MAQEKLWILLSHKLTGEATPEELQEFEALIQEHPDWQQALQGIDDIWKLPHRNDEMETDDAYLIHLQRMVEMNIPFGQTDVIDMASRKARKKRWYWAAAAAALLVGFFLFKGIINNGSARSGITRSVNEITTRPGSKSKVELPDGSVVWLNAGSKLTYNKEFGQTLREVTLSGEGFFDVAKMKDKPFIIHTSNINIKVLGTVFNVKAYPEDKRTETSLIRGRIEVTIKNRPNDKIILAPSEKLVVENDEAQAVKATAKPGAGSDEPRSQGPLVAVNKLRYNLTDSSVAETEWIRNRLVFRDESLRDLAVRMERWYGVTIDITDQQLADVRLNGTFNDETLPQALNELKEFIPFHYEQKGNKIIINR